MRLFSLGIHRQLVKKSGDSSIPCLCSDTGPNLTDWLALRATRQIGFGGIGLTAGFVRALICFYFKHLETIAGEQHYRLRTPGQ
jgi:hypothetical protein